MVPHQVHSASRLTSLEPFRVFKPAPHKHELVMTFVTGAGNVYWQIIETELERRADPAQADRASTR